MLGLHGLCHHTHIMLAVGKHVVLSTLVVQQRQGKEKQATVTARSRQGHGKVRIGIGLPEPLEGDAAWLEQPALWLTLSTRRRVCVWRRWAQGRAEALEPE